MISSARPVAIETTRRSGVTQSSRSWRSGTGCSSLHHATGLKPMPKV
nr:hypothetical protein [Mumia sp. ZJ430]